MVSIFDKTNNKRSIFHAYNSSIDSKNDAKNTRLNYLNIIEHRRFPVKLTKYLRTFLFTEDLCWLVLLLIRSSGYFKFILTESS